MEFLSKIIHIYYISISVCDLHETEYDRIDYDVDVHLLEEVMI